MRIVDSEGTSKLGFLRDERQDFNPFFANVSGRL